MFFLKLLIASEIGTDWKQRNWDENFKINLSAIKTLLRIQNTKTNKYSDTFNS